VLELSQLQVQAWIEGEYLIIVLQKPDGSWFEYMESLVDVPDNPDWELYEEGM